MPAKKTPKKSTKAATSEKKVAAKKTPAKKAAAKKAPAKKAAAKKAPAKKAAAKKAVTKKAAPKKAAKKAVAASAGFSLEDALSVASKRKTEKNDIAAAKIAEREKAQKAIEEAEKKAKARVLGAASLSDILGYNPAKPTAAPHQGKIVPKKYEKFYKLLMELRNHVATGLNAHAEETLKRSSKDDAGDLSGYSQHMADAGTDTFDRDFALSMVSSEQEALHEIDEAIDRIHAGTYGICEMTGKRIRDERLMAVPFTRYSIASQTQLEKNTHRSVQRGGVFSDATGEDALTFGSDDSDG